MRILLATFVLGTLLTACHQSPEPDRVKVPDSTAEAGYFPEGDANAGFGVFERMGCSTCHLIDGYDFGGEHHPRAKVLTLPRPGVTPRTDTALFTAIVDPGHQLDPAIADAARQPGGPMPTYRDVMTVQQLLDVIAFIKNAETTIR